MILKSELEVLDHKTMSVGMRNTFDCSAAIDCAKEASENGGRCPTSDEVMPLGFIPPEMFTYVPWLVEANKARSNGDMATYNENILKFFKLYPQFAVLSTKKYY